MRSPIRLSYANVASTLALFLALSTGTAYAVNEWTGANIVNDSLSGADVKESTLGLVPDADKLDGIDSKGFLMGASAATCCFGTARGKHYFNRVQTAEDGAESTFMTIPGMFRLVGSCFTSGGTSALLQVKTDSASLDFFYDRDDAQAVHLGTLPLGGSLQVFAATTRHVDLQAGFGQGSVSGQKLASLSIYLTHLSEGGCFFQASGMVQAT